MPSIQILNTEILSQSDYRLDKVTYTYTTQNGEDLVQQREIYHRNSSAAILLYDPERKSVLLAGQVRLPAYLNNDPSPFLLEACAGIMEEDELPGQCIMREAEEEMGYRLSEIEKIAEAYLSPGAITEYTYFFTGKYSPEMKISKGGGKKRRRRRYTGD